MPVHERDVADAAVAALLQTGQQGQGYDLSDPELITRRDQVGAIATAIGREMRLEVVTPEQAREHYRRRALPPTRPNRSGSRTYRPRRGRPAQRGLRRCSSGADPCARLAGSSDTAPGRQ